MTDRIEKSVVLRAPRARVWKAIADQGEFGEWFGVKFPAGVFGPGEKVSGKLAVPGYDHLTLEVEIVEVEPERKLSYRWHPYAIDPNVDYSSEPQTLVTFTLEEIAEGTRLTIVESGFENIPLHRRDEAKRMNDRGWAGQLTNVERHVSR